MPWSSALRLHPLDCSGDVEATPGIGRITPEAVADIVLARPLHAKYFNTFE